MSGTFRVLAGGTRLRPLSLLLAILAHGVALSLLLATWQPTDERDAQVVLVYLQPITLSRPAAPPAAPARPPPRASTAPTAPAPIIVPGTPAPSTAIELPTADWQHELELSARNVVREQVEASQRMRSLDSRPKALQLPGVSSDPKPGNVAVLPNGDLLITFSHGWTCTQGQPALDELFSVWARHRPQKCTKKGDGDASGKIELQPRDYLREPLADPPADN